MWPFLVRLCECTQTHMKELVEWFFSYMQLICFSLFREVKTNWDAGVLLFFCTLSLVSLLFSILWHRICGIFIHMHAWYSNVASVSDGMAKSVYKLKFFSFHISTWTFFSVAFCNGHIWFLLCFIWHPFYSFFHASFSCHYNACIFSVQRKNAYKSKLMARWRVIVDTILN